MKRIPWIGFVGDSSKEWISRYINTKETLTCSIVWYLKARDERHYLPAGAFPYFLSSIGQTCMIKQEIREEAERPLYLKCLSWRWLRWILNLMKLAVIDTFQLVFLISFMNQLRPWGGPPQTVCIRFLLFQATFFNNSMLI